MAKSNKQDTQQYISKIISDGRITQTEAQEAQSKGISLARIQKAQTKSFIPGNVFSRPGTSTPTPNAREVARGTNEAPAKPAYIPLVIQGSAQKVFDQGRQAAAPAPAPQQPQPQTGLTPLDVGQFEEPEGPTLEDVASMFADSIAQMQSNFQTNLQKQADMFATQAAEQEKRMSDLQQQMIQSQVMAAERPKTVGVKAATGAGGTQMAIARRGTTGAFGRGGMRISSLNV